jgi:ABC-type multidrug transport system fused ATPase/permease subunit
MYESFALINEFVKQNKTLVSAYFLSSIIGLILETVVISKILSQIYEKKKLDFYSIRDFILVFILLKFATTIKNYIYDMMTPLFQRFLKTHIFNSILDKYKVNYKDLNIGYVLYNFETMTKEFNELLIDILHDYVPVFFSLIISIIYLFWLNLTVGFISLIGVILFIIMITTRIKGGINKSHEQHKIAIQDSEHIQDKINNLFNIYVSGTENDEKLNYSELKDILQRATFENYFYYTVTSIYTSVILIILILIVFLKIKDAPNIVLILIVFTHLLDHIKKSSTIMSYFIGMLGYSGHSDKFLKEISSSTTELEDQNKGSKVQNLNGPVKFNNVNFSYSDKTDNLFDNLSLTVNKNEKIAIFGRSGTGKSTLIKLLYGFYDINGGNITIGGVNIKTMNIDDLRRNMTMSTQTVKIFEGSVLENILYGSNYTMSDLLSMYGNLLKIFSKLENGLDTKLFVNGSNVSGGQKQIISVLRALLKNTPIVILDEPTVGLDEKTKGSFLDVIKSIKNKTIIIITHDKDIIKHVDKMYELISGKLMLIKK